MHDVCITMYTYVGIYYMNSGHTMIGHAHYSCFICLLMYT